MRLIVVFFFLVACLGKLDVPVSRDARRYAKRAVCTMVTDFADGFPDPEGRPMCFPVRPRTHGLDVYRAFTELAQRIGARYESPRAYEQRTGNMYGYDNRFCMYSASQAQSIFRIIGCKDYQSIT